MNNVTNTTINAFASVLWSTTNGGCMIKGTLIIYPKVGSTGNWGIAPFPNSNLKINQSTYNSVVGGVANVNGSYQDLSNSLGAGSNVNYYLVNDGYGSCVAQVAI